jgi:hypothetical protein
LKPLVLHAGNIHLDELKSIYHIHLYPGSDAHTRYEDGECFTINRVYRADQKRYYNTLEFL